MKFSGRNQGLSSSLLDKLIAPPERAVNSSKSNLQQLHGLRLGIRRDLENLLNTRRAPLTWPSEWDQLNRSLLAYGIPDITGAILDTAELQNQFCQNLREAIERFETRLKNIKVSIMQGNSSLENTLSLRIEALLLVEPTPELIVFDSQFKPEMGIFSLVDAGESGAM